MNLDPQKYDEYWQRGWTIVAHVFSREEADHIQQLANQFCERPEFGPSTESQSLDQKADGEVVPRKLILPFLRHADFRRFATDERLRSLVQQVIGKPVYLMTDQIFMKPPRFGSAKPYHQDNAYFRCHPDDEGLTAWIALDDVDESNGCLRYIDGSHHGPILEHHIDPVELYNQSPAQEDIDLSRESLACVGKGGVVFHHWKALHTSHRNESDRWRRGYATHWATAEVTSQIDTIDKAYYVAHPELYREIEH